MLLENWWVGFFTSITPEAQASCPVRSSAARQETLQGSFDCLRFLHKFRSLKNLKKNDPLFPSPTGRSKERLTIHPLLAFEIAIRTSPTPTQTVPMAMLQVRGSWSSQADNSTPQTGEMKPKLETRVGL